MGLSAIVGVEYRRMQAVTIRSLLVLIALLTLGQQHAATMRSWNRSMEPCGRNASTRTGSQPWPRPNTLSNCGAGNTTWFHTAPPRYVVENRLACLLESGIAGRRVARDTRRFSAWADSLWSTSLLIIHGPSARGWSAATSPRSIASRRVLELTSSRAAASVRFIHARSCSSRWYEGMW
jgi:hypothetical protein